MAWKTVAVAQSEDELRTLKPSIADIPNGSQVLITIELPAWLPLAHIVNLPVEWVTQQLLIRGQGIEVIDVRAEGFHTIEIHGIARGVPLLYIIPGLIIILAFITGWTVVRVSYYEMLTAQVEAEEAKAEVTTQALKEGYSLDEINTWLEGLKAPPPEYKSIVDQVKSALPAIGISTGVLLLIVAAVFFLGRR